MNTAVINIKTEQEVKSKAQKVARELGFSLSALINAYLKDLIKTRTVFFSSRSEEPSKYFISMLKKSRDDIKKGKIVSFNTTQDALSYLDGINKE
ncbi:MAG: type II toxin-antitoxin system RelB/DinJ family antitoxin [bacterium]|nr:type II toxin-antitoxin system RelB/DinJ family antitoxin [bacterium]